MLFQMVERTCGRLDALDVHRDQAGMLRQILAARPETGGDRDEVARLVAEGVPLGVVREFFAGVDKKVAEVMIARAKESATIARRMTAVIRGNEVSLSAQVGLVVVLLYFVDPQDLVPDGAEGGYGFLDDAVLLRAGLIELLDELPPDPMQQEKHGDYIGMFASVLPPGVVPVLERLVRELQGIVRVLRGYPSGPLALLRDQLISTGRLANIPAVPRGAVPTAPGFPGNLGHWDRGVYFEGRNAMVPGGPSLIDGKLTL